MADCHSSLPGKTPRILKTGILADLPVCARRASVVEEIQINGFLAVTKTSELLTIHGAADFLGVHRSFLDRRRVAGGGPRYIRLSARVIRYAPEDLAEWLDGNRRANTSEVSEGRVDA